jgi:hypothetical protein
VLIFIILLFYKYPIDRVVVHIAKVAVFCYANNQEEQIGKVDWVSNNEEKIANQI